MPAKSKAPPLSAHSKLVARVLRMRFQQLAVARIELLLVQDALLMEG
jgi:hypothetical protein